MVVALSVSYPQDVVLTLTFVLLAVKHSSFTFESFFSSQFVLIIWYKKPSAYVNSNDGNLIDKLILQRRLDVFVVKY